MSVFFPTPLLDYTEKFNRQYSIEQQRIQEMQKHRAEYYENKNNEHFERKRVQEAQEKLAEFEKLSRNQAYEQLERNRQSKYTYYLGAKIDKYI
tara:strand:- start:2766 stop:3047 length:282 start_codon:yes stop_codon:yes gene_type:complete